MPELKRGHEEDLSMDEDFRRCKRHTSKKKKYRHVSKLLSLAAEGKHKKLARLLRKHSELDVNSYNSDGLTALHQVLILLKRQNSHNAARNFDPVLIQYFMVA